MNKYSEAFTKLLAAQTLAEAKNVSKYLRKNTSLSIDARNKIAESYFKKSLKEKVSQLKLSEAAAPGIFETFMSTIGAWANELFGALGTVLKVIISGMMKLYDFFFGAGGALNLGKGSTAPGVLNRVLGKVFGMDITGGQALFMAAIFGLMIWGIFKVCSWLKKKTQFSESFVPMFSEADEGFLRRLASRAKEVGNKAKEKSGVLSMAARKLAAMCVERGVKAYKAAKKYAYDPMIAKISPKYAQFIDAIGPKFMVMKTAVMTKVNSAGEWVQGYNPMKLRAKLATANATVKDLGGKVAGLGKEVVSLKDNLAKSLSKNDSLTKQLQNTVDYKAKKTGQKVARAIKDFANAPANVGPVNS